MFADTNNLINDLIMALVSLLIEKTVLDEAKAQKLISVKGAFHLEMREMFSL